MEYKFISLGFNCATALVLRDLGLRTTSLPFDWVVTNNMQVINCIENNFEKFHKKLDLTEKDHWVIDEYGIQYPHDYPTNEDESLVDNWRDYQQEVLSKYNRRIQRFFTILNSNESIIVLYLGFINYAITLKRYFEKKFNKRFVFVVGTFEKPTNQLEDIIIVSLKSNDESRNKDYWKPAIDKAISIIKSKGLQKDIQSRKKIFMNFF